MTHLSKGYNEKQWQQQTPQGCLETGPLRQWQYSGRVLKQLSTLSQATLSLLYSQTIPAHHTYLWEAKAHIKGEIIT